MASTIAGMSKEAPPSRTAPQFVVRMPDDDFRNRIAEAAKANNRSMNAEILARLERSFADQGDGMNAEERKTLETSLIAVQTMLAFHVREFWDLLPADVKVKPVNVAVRNMALAIGHGSSNAIEEAMRIYFKAGQNADHFAQVAETLHQRRQQLDEGVKDLPPEREKDATLRHLRAKP